MQRNNSFALNTSISIAIHLLVHSSWLSKDHFDVLTHNSVHLVNEDLTNYLGRINCHEISRPSHLFTDELPPNERRE